MRITIDLSRVNRVPRVRTKWYANGDDDIRMTNLGIILYDEWVRLLDSLKLKMNGNMMVVENLGEQK